MTLYEINEKIRVFLEENVDPETGEVLNLDLLESLEIERSEKLENYALVCKNYDAEIAALKFDPYKGKVNEKVDKKYPTDFPDVKHVQKTRAPSTAGYAAPPAADFAVQTAAASDDDYPF